jgi:hypothetical protein
VLTNRRTAQDLADALARVLDRMGTKAETLEQAVDAVYADYGDRSFRNALLRYARGDR